MTTDDEPLTIVLRRTDGGPARVVAGSTTIVAGCGHTCWIAPSGLSALRERQAADLPVDTMCIPCVTAGRGPDIGGLAPLGSLPGQLDEARASGLTDADVAVSEALLKALAQAGRKRRN